MITSMSNPQVKRLILLQKKSKIRMREKVFIAEGYRMLSEAPGERVEKVYLSETAMKEIKEKGNFFRDMADMTGAYKERGQKMPCRKEDSVTPPCGTRYEILSDAVFARVSDTRSPQGVLAVVRQERYDRERLLNIRSPLFIILDGLQDPGNLGTIVRTAEAAGADAVFLGGDCADLYNPKTVRSTMGSIYRVPVLMEENLPALLAELRTRGVKSYAAHLSGENSYDREDYRSGAAFLIGNEGNGLSREVILSADTLIRIPMHGQAESLNAAVAAAVLLYEAGRQRRFTDISRCFVSKKVQSSN